MSETLGVAFSEELEAMVKNVEAYRRYSEDPLAGRGWADFRRDFMIERRLCDSEFDALMCEADEIADMNELLRDGNDGQS